MEKVRVNMYLPADLKEWYVVEAEKNGFNLTTMIQVAMLDYKKQQEAMHSMGMVSSLEQLINKGASADLGIARGIVNAIQETRG